MEDIQTAIGYTFLNGALLDEALKHLSDLKTALDDIAREYDNKYSLTNACGRARHALALLRQRLIEIKRL